MARLEIEIAVLRILMTSDDNTREWKSRANAEYQKVVGSVTALSTTALVLPPFFLRDFAGVANGKPLLPHLSGVVFFSWGFLLLSILFAILFQYVSAKWLKNAYGGDVKLKEGTLECLLDCFFWLAVGCFIAGLVCMLWFATTLQAVS
jgi:hypothetical protein